MIFFRNVLTVVLSLFSSLFQGKNTDDIIIHAYPDFDDMTIAVESVLEGRNITILTSSRNLNRPAWLRDSTKIYYKWSVMGLIGFIKAKYVIFTHGIYESEKKIKSKIYINVWHGMPLKNIGLLDGKHKAVVASTDYTLSTSPRFTELMAQAFGISIDKVLEIGLPRNDLLKANFQEDYFVWLPTYRQSNKLDVRLDGEALPGLFGLSFSKIDLLNTLLVRNNLIIYVKPHPMDAAATTNRKFSNIIIIDEAYLIEKSTTLYSMLAKSKALISDVSSVVVDYWLTEKPIFLFFSDAVEYKESRGLTFNLNFEEVFGGFYSETDDGFIQSISSFIDGDLAWDKKWHEHGFHSSRYESSIKLSDFIGSLS